MSSAEPSAGTAPPLAAIPATPIEERHRALLEDLTAKLDAGVVGSHQRTGDLWVRVRAEDWLRAAEELRSMGFDYLCYLSGIDWLPATWPNPKVIEGPEGGGAGVVDADDEAALPVDENAVEDDQAEAPSAGDAITTGFAGGDTRFQILARLYSTTRKIGVNLKADLDDEAPHVQTWISVFPGADWCERETWEMYGFLFDGHPNLVHLYLPGEFEGFPLRKDFPLLAREVKPWPGLVDVEPMPEVPDPAGGAEASAEEGAA
ncbi:MAG: NADH-quinone oxidoreductase subunit C [Actinomycetota bacterium]|nr:NADH-quinone oxidoreductase subunit C [Actinomycetota bacterium]